MFCENGKCQIVYLSIRNRFETDFESIFLVEVRVQNAHSLLHKCLVISIKYKKKCVRLSIWLNIYRRPLVVWMTKCIAQMYIPNPKISEETEMQKN